ncbi:glycosyltransferase family 4 protein [Geomonas sp. RF6]|uniref:glycosyltransferase family 4 protein n=1 Tax=Geomonas sp. RF6 TaxID=2897342 RepID=UPI001E336C86|nr:glycosyltransferase family 4 protein [Geomonas sp. RF6]UFS72414.1 glycosyltransferase family 4 protein [Geomonas sp. RF6]
MKVSMPQGAAHGWGIAGTYLSREIAKLPPIPGVTLHCMLPTLAPLQTSVWDEINIGYCFFEDSIEILNYTRMAGRRWDYIVAGSKWCEYQLRIGGVKNCCTILQGVDPANFRPHPLPPDDRFVVFSGGKFEFRKGQDLVIAAMRVFMERHHDAWLSCIWANQWPFSLATMGMSPYIRYQHDENDFLTLPARTAVANGLDPRRVIAHPLIPNHEVAHAFAGTHIGLFPNRCEGGNNMVMCEYMACGRTVIASDGSGHADVITPDNAYPLTRYRPMVVTGTGGAATSVWEEPELDEIVELLETAYQRRHELSAKGARAAASMERLDWGAAARQFHYVATRLANERELKKARR